MFLRSGIASAEDGAAAIEFALVSVLLVMLLGGIVQFGLIFNRWQMIEHAAREGVRWASLRNTAATVKAAVQDAAPGVVFTSISVTPADPSLAVPGTPATVRAETSVPVFAPMFTALLGEDVVLAGQATQRVE